MSKQTNIGEAKKKKKQGSKSSANKDDEVIPSSSENPKSFIGEIDMDNLDVETIEKIQDHEQPSIQASEDEIVSVPDTEPDGTADCVHQGLTNTNIRSTVESTNGKPSTIDEVNSKVGTSPTRLLKNTPNPDRTIDGFLKPTTPKRKRAKSSKDPINSVIPTTVIDTSEASKLKADLEAKDIILKTYEVLPISHKY